jgi:hypothetical protein
MTTQYKFGIIDKLSTLNDLDRYQVENIAWLRLASVEKQVRRAYFKITPEPNSEFDRQYRAEWAVELKSGQVVKTLLSKATIGAAVIRSAEQMGDKVARRVAFEGTWAFRVLNSAQEACSRILANREAKQTGGCRQTVA